MDTRLTRCRAGEEAVAVAQRDHGLLTPPSLLHGHQRRDTRANTRWPVQHSTRIHSHSVSGLQCRHAAPVVQFTRRAPPVEVVPDLHSPVAATRQRRLHPTAEPQRGGGEARSAQDDSGHTLPAMAAPDGAGGAAPAPALASMVELMRQAERTDGAATAPPPPSSPPRPVASLQPRSEPPTGRGHLSWRLVAVGWWTQVATAVVYVHHQPLLVSVIVTEARRQQWSGKYHTTVDEYVRVVVAGLQEAPQLQYVQMKDGAHGFWRADGAFVVTEAHMKGWSEAIRFIASRAAQTAANAAAVVDGPAPVPAAPAQYATVVYGASVAAATAPPTAPPATPPRRSARTGAPVTTAQDILRAVGARTSEYSATSRGGSVDSSAGNSVDSFGSRDGGGGGYGAGAGSVASAPVHALPPSAPKPECSLVRSYFCSPSAAMQSAFGSRCGLADADGATQFAEAMLLGQLNVGGGAPGGGPAPTVYLNTHEPFCLATVGVQGAGKSHTLACVLEGCLLPFPEEGVVRLNAPMTALVLHYGQNVASQCEATGLVAPAAAVQDILRQLGQPARYLPRERLVVLVSPAYYRQRKAFYGDTCTVRPLLFHWRSLSADHIKRIMRLRDGDNQLYVAAMLDLLRRYQRAGQVPAFPQFKEEVTDACSAPAQRGPLQQRLALLEALVADSDINADLRADGADLAAACQPGTLVVADMTDPMLASDEANGIFQVLTEQFRALSAPGGKVLALDEAHRFMDGDATDGLSDAIVAVARLVRHDGMRLVVSTQNPKALAPELLELVTVALLHRFHSREWFAYLAKKLPLADAAWAALADLLPGQALAFASQHRVRCAGAPDLGTNVFPVTIRPRFTADRGNSRTNLPVV